MKWLVISVKLCPLFPFMDDYLQAVYYFPYQAKLLNKLVCDGPQTLENQPVPL